MQQKKSFRETSSARIVSAAAGSEAGPQAQGPRRGLEEFKRPPLQPARDGNSATACEALEVEPREGAGPCGCLVSPVGHVRHVRY